MLQMFASLLIVFASTDYASADYLVTGKFEGSFCSGFVIEVCKFQRIDASGKNGQLFQLPERFDHVTEYKSGRCWRKVHSSWYLGLTGNIPTFYRYIGGPKHLVESYEDLGTPDFITFKCEKQ